MIPIYTHTRAALLGFGGWGLQTLLHLLPRLQAAQQRRDALTNAPSPDLTRTTSMAVLLPDAAPSDEQVTFHLYQLGVQSALEPFYLERTLERLRHESRLQNFAATPATESMTVSERQALALRRAVAPLLQRLGPADGFVFPTSQSHSGRATRSDLFRAALHHADAVAQLLDIHLVDPIRDDSLVPDDPYVQTALYAVAPLYEPLATALIWPTVAGLMARLSRRHLTQVVGLWAMGSYATDASRGVENAAAVRALDEMEALTGMDYMKNRGWSGFLPEQAENSQWSTVNGKLLTGREDDAGGEETVDGGRLRGVVEEENGELGEHVGELLFDYVYLLDREKSNQGMAQASDELSVLAGNALEAFLTAGGGLYVQEQLGVGLHGVDTKPYSLLGAAGDYVPVTQLLYNVSQREGRRLVRENVLAQDDVHTSQNVDENLGTLGILPGQALATLVSRLPELHAQRTPVATSELAVARDFVLSPAAALGLRQFPLRWGEAFETHRLVVDEYFALAAGRGAIRRDWGVEATDALEALDFETREGDARLVPAATRQIHETLLLLGAAGPTGLLAAREQAEAWLHALRAERQRLQAPSVADVKQLSQIQRELVRRDWHTRYDAVARRNAGLGTTLARAALLIGLVALLAWGYAFAAQNLLGPAVAWNAQRDGLALAGVAVGILAASLIGHRQRAGRVAVLRRERVALVQAELTARLQRNARDALLDVYDELIALLRAQAKLWGEAVADLRAWSRVAETPDSESPGEFTESAAPQSLYPSHLYQPHVSGALWARCSDYLGSQRDAQGRRSRERLHELWGNRRWLAEARGIVTGVLPSEVSTALLPGESPARSLADLVRHTVSEAADQVDRERLAAANHPDEAKQRRALVRELAGPFGVEEMLWRNRTREQEISRYLRALGSGERPDLPGTPDRALAAAGQSIGQQLAPDEERDVVPGGQQLAGYWSPAAENQAEISQRRYLETVWSRAKPTANYDVADRLATHGVLINFAAASGHPQSDLAGSLQQDLGVALLATQDPYSLLLVRTVHGLGADDIESVQRYRAEWGRLDEAGRKLLAID